MKVRRGREWIDLGPARIPGHFSGMSVVGSGYMPEGQTWMSTKGNHRQWLDGGKRSHDRLHAPQEKTCGVCGKSFSTRQPARAFACGVVCRKRKHRAKVARERGAA